MCPFELVATPMPSPMWMLGGNFRKLGTEVNAMSGALRAFAGVCVTACHAQSAAAAAASRDLMSGEYTSVRRDRAFDPVERLQHRQIYDHARPLIDRTLYPEVE